MLATLVSTSSKNEIMSSPAQLDVYNPQRSFNFIFLVPNKFNTDDRAKKKELNLICA